MRTREGYLLGGRKSRKRAKLACRLRVARKQRINLWSDTTPSTRLRRKTKHGASLSSSEERRFELKYWQFWRTTYRRDLLTTIAVFLLFALLPQYSNGSSDIEPVLVCLGRATRKSRVYTIKPA